MSGPRVRFAPSPTGSLHLGNARTALFNWLLARHERGTFILRVEDTDVAREQEGSEASILEDLRWLALSWDEGPFRQSERLDVYRGEAARLVEERRAFRCFCPARADEGARAAGYRDPCRAIEPAAAAARAGEAHAIRFLVPDGDAVRFDDRLRDAIAIPLSQIPDAVILRDGGRPTYNFAAVVDDRDMRIDLVLRGDDHLTNTALQILLYRALGAAPPAFAHLPMVLGPDGERLSKRHGADSVASWRARGVPPEALVNALALLGWSPSGDRTIVSAEEMVAEFTLDRVGRSAAVFDPAKLDWISAQYVQAMPAGSLAAGVGERLVAAGRIAEDDRRAAGPWVGAVAEFLRTSLARFDQTDVQCEPIFHAGGALDDDARAVLGAAGAREVLIALAAGLEAKAPADGAAWNALRDAIASATGTKGRALFQPLRVALTGRAHGRELDRIVPLVASGHAALPTRVPALIERARRALGGLA